MGDYKPLAAWRVLIKQFKQIMNEYRQMPLGAGYTVVEMPHLRTQATRGETLNRQATKEAAA